MVLPRFVVLKSKQNGKYLRYLRNDTESLAFIQSSGDDVTSPIAKFELEPSETKNSSGSNYVHVKCCYNDKYWSLMSEDCFWIVASSDKKVEDKSKWFCTLFDPVPESDDNDVLVRLQHVHLSDYLCQDTFDQSHDSMLIVGTKSPDDSFRMSDIFKVIDWDSLVILPKHVTFKGDNGKYLGACTYRETLHFLEFSFTEIGNQATGHEVSIVGDGWVRLKSDYNGKYWCGTTGWVRAECDESGADDNSDTNLFWPVKVGENTIALRHKGSNRFCKRYTDYWVDSLCASLATITNEAKLVVEELVVSRDIYNIVYHIKDARIYEGERITLDTLTATNRSNVSDTAQLNFEHTDIISSTWTAHSSVTYGVKVEFDATIPIVGAGGKAEISSSVTFGIQWAKTIETQQKHSTGHTATVPPMSKVKIIMVATRGTCRVPFSYTQRDTLTDGKVVITQQDGGIYTAKNCFNYCTEKDMEAL